MSLHKPKATGVALFLLCLMYLITYVNRMSLATAAEPIRNEFKLSSTQLGYAFSAFGYAYLPLQIIGGWIADRFGARKPLTISGLIWAFSTILTGLTTSLATLFGARILLGIGEGTTFPAATRAMVHWTPSARWAYAQGITHSFARMGNAIAPLLMVVLMASLTWRGSFIALGAVSLVWVLVWGIFFRDNPRDHSAVSKEEIAALPPFRGAAQLRKVPVPWNVLVPRMVPVIIVYFCYGWTFWVYLNWLPSFFLQALKLNLRDSALFSAGIFLAGVIGDAAGGLFSDWILLRTGDVVRARSRLVFATMVSSLVCLLPVLFIHDLVAIAVFLSFAFFFLEVTIGPMWALAMDIAPHYSGTASGLLNTGSALAAIVSPIAFGVIVDKTGNWFFPFIGSIVLLGIGALLSFTMHPERVLHLPAPEKSAEIGPGTVAR